MYDSIRLHGYLGYSFRRGRALGLFLLGAWFSSWYVVSIGTGAYSSKSTVWPKKESCFQDRACSVSSFRRMMRSFISNESISQFLLQYRTYASIKGAALITYFQVSPSFSVRGNYLHPTYFTKIYCYENKVQL